MFSSSATTWYHSNHYNAQAACEHCSGVIRHESWCITANPLVFYAYEAVLDADKLSVGDVLVLHSLGVVWTGKVCQRNCQRPQ